MLHSSKYDERNTDSNLTCVQTNYIGFSKIGFSKHCFVSTIVKSKYIALHSSRLVD